jgi:hypothetical protein
MSGLTQFGAFPEARRLYDSYRALYNIAGSYMTPTSYSWLTPPSSTYPDAGNALIDRRMADPTNPRSPGWAGVIGNAAILFDLGSVSGVSTVGVHLIDNQSWGIHFPSSMDIYCRDGGSRVLLGHQDNTVGNVDSEYVLANTQPLSGSCRLLEVFLSNDEWTFLDEVEITGQ